MIILKRMGFLQSAESGSIFVYLRSIFLFWLMENQWGLPQYERIMARGPSFAIIIYFGDGILE